MSTGLIIGLSVAAVVLLIIIGIIACYNGLVKLNTRVEEAWSDITVQLKRRADLIPNLVETVKGYAAHESETLQAVIDARAKATGITVDASNLSEEALAKFQSAQGELTQALGRLIAVSESYPDLKANQNFLELQSQLEGTENRITVERNKFNETAQGYNTNLRSFPTNIIAGLFNFEKKGYFKAAEGAETAPKVEF